MLFLFLLAINFFPSYCLNETFQLILDFKKSLNAQISEDGTYTLNLTDKISVKKSDSWNIIEVINKDDEEQKEIEKQKENKQKKINKIEKELDNEKVDISLKNTKDQEPIIEEEKIIRDISTNSVNLFLSSSRL